MKPALFVAIDTFELDRPSWSGRQAYKDILGDLGHEAYYRAQFRTYIERGVLVVKKGYSHVMLAEFDDAFFDMIYIDAAHDYDSVRRDLTVAKAKIKPEGYIVLNDYPLMDPLLSNPMASSRPCTSSACRRAGRSDTWPYTPTCSAMWR